MRKIRMTPVRLLVLGFLAIIAAGTCLLLLPVSTRSGESPAFMDALFTAVTSTCVTGLVTQDTYSHWSTFGHVVILVLIQTGGIGFMTVVFALWNLGTFLFEALGAFVMCFRFVPDFGWGRGIWMSVFTAVSAFCNAGIDLMGIKGEPFASMTSYSGDPVICLTIPILILVGGLGFFVWQDIKNNRLHLRKYSLHTKLVLVTTAVLVVVPWAIMIIAENNLPWQERILSTFFTAVTPRTAGFNVLPLSGAGSVRQVTIFLSIVLMFIGGSSGSTAGGIKTNTLAALVLSVVSLLRGKRSVECFGRRLDEENVKNAAQFVTLYLLFAMLGVILICIFEQENAHVDSLTAVVFEVISALSTVGLTLGITPFLSVGSELVLSVLMYLGRVGCMTFMLSLRTPSAPAASLPLERIRIG